MEKWLKQFIENYEGKSKEAKSIEGFIKENYKGNTYVPWATMERLTYIQDPNATFEVVRNDINNSIVWTDSQVMVNEVVQKGEIVNKTTSVMYSHFVRVKLTFLDKVFEEDYPIQDQDYSALKVYNQNAVNKALQRAKAKIASRATGLGLKLYEGKDLQFDTPVEEIKPEVKKTNKKVKTTEEQKVENIEVKIEENVAKETQDVSVQEEPTQKVVVSSSYSNDIIELCTLIKTTPVDKMTAVLQTLNVAILKQHGFTLNQTDDTDMLCEKLSHFKDVKIFTKAINRMLG